TSPRDARGSALIQYRTAAGDASIKFGTSFRVLGCGSDTATGSAIDPAVCSNLQAASWVVNDRFTAGNVGKHVDLYIGEQTSAHFIDSPEIIDTSNAILQF
ncbi:MAG: hypothetical protein M3N19_02900, partial [Candidatus Eremiobacteraeota bacterium]|nr:hypothetical protein [Candidatus Eremiobacteraeota bacterium]